MNFRYELVCVDHTHPSMVLRGHGPPKQSERCVKLIRFQIFFGKKKLSFKIFHRKKNWIMGSVFFHPIMKHNYAIFQKKSNMNVPKCACNLCGNFCTFWSCVSLKLSPHVSVPGLFVQYPVQALLTGKRLLQVCRVV